MATIIDFATGAPIHPSQVTHDEAEDQAERTETLAQRKVFGDCVKKVIDRYEAGDVDVLVVGYVSASGTPFPMIGSHPSWATSDVVAAGAMVDAFCRNVAMSRYYRSQPDKIEADED
jgi:hypothetical protein